MKKTSNKKHKNNTGAPDNAHRRKRTKHALHESEEKYVMLVKNATDCVIIVQDTVIKFANKRMAEMFGYSVKELIGKSIYDLVPPDFVSVIKERVALREQGKDIPEIFYVRLLCKDGTIKETESSSRVIQYEGRWASMAIIRNITERKYKEEEISKLSSVVRFSSELVNLATFEGKMIFLNEAGNKMLGINPDEVGNYSIMDVIPESFHPIVRKELLPALLAGKTWEGELQYRNIKTGSLTDVYAMTFNIKDSSTGKNLCLANVSHDITAHKKAEDALKKSEEKYRLLADHMKDQVWLMDLDLKWKYISPSVEKLLGYNLKELKQLPLNKLLTATSFQKAMEHFSTQLSRALPSSTPSSTKNLVELEFICKNGKFLWGECSFSFIRDENGKPLSILGEGRDITDRKRAEEKLRYEEHRFRTFAEQSSDIIVIVNPEGIITYENQTVERALGFKPEERIGGTLFDLIHPDDLKLLNDASEKLASDKNSPALQYEVRLRHKNGSWRTFEVAGSNLVNDTVVEGVIINLHDITQRKQSEEKLKQTLESLKRAVGTTIQVLVSVLEVRDPYTAGHQTRVAHLASAIATEMGLAQEKIEGIRMAGSIHDIGKLSIPVEILSKPTILTDTEFALIKVHPQTGYDMLKDVESPWPLAQIVYQHHERMNGSGYPNNLKGDKIIMEARIMAVADVVEAMASHRPYRAALGIDMALEEIRKNKGILYDETVVDICLKLFTEKGYHFPTG
ncbi:MAG: hypothetical protein APR62_08435 [Smithella sp. SDB]|nr:MAG: hypothetical protein APR62_08435 [Smithella sp. SDB]